MSAFLDRLAERQPDPEGRRWLFVPYDQLGDGSGPLAEEPPEELGIVLVENRWKATRRAYHKQKLALVVANLRHFGLEQAGRGVAVRHLAVDGPYVEALEPLADELGPLRVREPAERELRADIAPLVEGGGLEVVPHDGWLTTEAQFAESQPADAPPWRMDAFYRHVRRASGILMEDGSPAGGKYSHDADNREPWPGEPSAPTPPEFPLDEVKEEVVDLIEAEFGDHPGALAPAGLPATAEDAAAAWEWAKRECMEHFGPFEDAMSHESATLFHTRISPLLNLGRLEARAVLKEAVALSIPLSSKEGFVRQLLGWREFVRHVHRETDGFRRLPDPYAAERNEDGLADPSWLEVDEPLPEAYWGTASGMACLDRVVADVLEEGWSHHITRLMVLSNVAQLLDVRPRALADWFWEMYVDAYDWVVEPNVLAMGSYGVGDVMTTKPYVSGSNYIDRMSDYCGACRFDPGHDCPLKRLYWAYLGRHEERLSGNRRLGLPLASLSRRDEAERRLDARTFDWARETLAAGEELTPDEAPQAGAGQ